MSEKTINYMARDFNTIKSELISLSKQYYPELADSFNDASVGSWLIDLVSAVGDDLNYYIDRCYNEQNVNTASLRSSVLNTARANNFKVPGPKAAMCEVAVSIDLPPNDSNNMSQPDWRKAPKIKQGAVVSNGSVDFEILEDIDFKEQFNRNAISNRRFVPLRNSRGAITSYRVTKTVLASSGRSRIYKKILTKGDIKPFMEILLPFKNIMEVEGVLVKDTQNLMIDPDLYEFHVDTEQFYVGGESIKTYRYFEVNSLADQYRFGTQGTEPIESIDTDVPSETEDGCGRELIQYVKGEWIPITQKYITEYTDNGYLKLIFGSGMEITSLKDGKDASEYAKNQLTKIANNELTGVLPKPNTVLYVLYRDGGGQIANISPNSLNKLAVAEWEWPSSMTDNQEISKLKKTVRATNTSQAIAGVNAPNVNEIKYLTRYNNSAQERCVTLKDYELKVKTMPSKFGAPYRCKAIEDNNKIFIYMLGINSKGKLTNEISDEVCGNIVNYLSNYKCLGDLVELRSAQIFNITVDVYASISKTYNKESVIKSIITTVKDFFAVEDHNLGEDLYIGDLEREISSIDGVVNFEKLYINSIVSSSPTDEYSHVHAPMPFVDNITNAKANEKRIDLESTNKVLNCDARGMFEIKDYKKDIRVRIRTI